MRVVWAVLGVLLVAALALGVVLMVVPAAGVEPEPEPEPSLVDYSNALAAWPSFTQYMEAVYWQTSPGQVRWQPYDPAAMQYDPATGRCTFTVWVETEFEGVWHRAHFIIVATPPPFDDNWQGWRVISYNRTA